MTAVCSVLRHLFQDIVILTLFIRQLGCCFMKYVLLYHFISTMTVKYSILFFNMRSLRQLESHIVIIMKKICSAITVVIGS